MKADLQGNSEPQEWHSGKSPEVFFYLTHLTLGAEEASDPEH